MVRNAVWKMILGALNANGGQKWFVQQAEANPVAFMALVFCHFGHATAFQRFPRLPYGSRS